MKKIFPGVKIILKKGNPESKEQQKKRKRSVGKAHVKVQTRFERHPLLSFLFLLFVYSLSMKHVFI